MSEPFSAVAQVTIERPALVAYLNDAPSRASGWSDWRRIGGEWHGFSWDNDLPGYLASVDRRLTESYRHAVRHLIAPDIVPGTERCAYDAPHRRFTFATLMISENLEELLMFFAVARGLAKYIDAGATGFAVVQDYLWGQPAATLAVLQIEPGRSAFLDAHADAAIHQRCAAAATAVFDDIKAAAGAPGRVIDELDALR
jgi:hypothetical protein